MRWAVSCLAVLVLLLVQAVPGLAFQATPAERTAPASVAGRDDPDTDGDGLSDFQERHKYRTDPNKADPADPPGATADQQRRRASTYSVRALIRVMPPYNLAAMNDDYQDVRVVSETKDYVELEVVAYPLNTNGEAIPENARWQQDAAAMHEYLAPGVSTNWDPEMRKRVIAELEGAGIVLDRLTDKQVVEQVSRWLYRRSHHRNMFCTYFVHFPHGKPAVFPGLESAFQANKGDRSWSDDEQFASELLGRSMFERKVYGTCTSAAVAQATVLRACGIPTRIILAIPVVDASDEDQFRLAEQGITNQAVRSTVLTALAGAADSFANHTYLEVYVGGRWRRLNYSVLGQNILDPKFFGLMIHVHTFNDLSEANLAPTWGARYALHRRDGVFRHSNPYRTMAQDDHLGKHAKVPDPPAQKEHKVITIDRAYWPTDADAPAEVREMVSRSGGAGDRFFVHGAEWFQDMDHLQYKVFMRRADRNFLLKADGHPDVKCYISMSFVTNGSTNLRDLEVAFTPGEKAKLDKDVKYKLHPLNTASGYRWRVKDGLTLALPVSLEDKVRELERRLEVQERRMRGTGRD